MKVDYIKPFKDVAEIEKPPFNWDFELPSEEEMARTRTIIIKFKIPKFFIKRRK